MKRPIGDWSNQRKIECCVHGGCRCHRVGDGTGANTSVRVEDMCLLEANHSLTSPPFTRAVCRVNQKTASTIKRDISGTSMDAAGRMVVDPLRTYLALHIKSSRKIGSETFFSTVPPVASSSNLSGPTLQYHTSTTRGLCGTWRLVRYREAPATRTTGLQCIGQQPRNPFRLRDGFPKTSTSRK